MKSHNQTIQSYFKYLHRLQGKPVTELIEIFNNEVDNHGWTSSRGVFLEALRRAFELSNYYLDPEVFKKNATSYARKIYLSNNKVLAVRS